MRDVLEEYYAKRDAEQIQMYQRMLEEANQKVFKITEEYALALLQLGASLQEISEKTQLPIERIQKLAQEQEDKH